MIDIIAIVHVCLQEVIDFGGIAQMFNQGAHHPTVLVVLQALTATIGEVLYLKMLHIVHVYVMFKIML